MPAKLASKAATSSTSTAGHGESDCLSRQVPPPLGVSLAPVSAVLIQCIRLQKRSIFKAQAKNKLQLRPLSMENACKNLNQVVRSVRLLKIDGFSLTLSLSSEYRFTSRWNVDGYDLEVGIYPAANPLYPDGNKFVSVRLMFLSKARTECGVPVSLACQLVDRSGELEPFKEDSVSETFFAPHYFKELLLVNRKSIPSAYLRDDSLTLRCAITMLKELPVQTIPAEEVIAVPSTNLHQHLGELLESETGADVTFLVCDESFAAHKDILAARSPVFKAQFFGDMKEKCSQRVEVKDMEVAAFRAMLHFIYTDTVPELDQPLELVATLAQHLLAAADWYGLDRLKLICEMKLSGGITVDTAATTLALAEQHNCSKLKAKCVEFIVSTPAVLDDVLATEGYRHLEASCPSVLTELLKSVHGSKC